MRYNNQKKINYFLRAWLLSHKQCFIYSLKQYFDNLFANILITTVIAVCLALPSGFYLLLENAKKIASDWDDTFHITAFLKPNISDKTATDVMNRFLQNTNIKAAKLINREQALLEYKELSGFSEIIDLLDENPLPSMIVVTPKIDALADSEKQRIINFIQAQPEVEITQYDQQWIKRLHGIIEITHRCIIIFCIFIGAGVLIIIGNTIRMAIYQRRHEIEIIKLLGATNQFIQRPFLYTGLWHGLGSGITSWCLLTFALRYLQEPISKLSASYASQFSLIGLSTEVSLIIFACSILLSLSGSWISVQRHLRNP